MSAAAERLTPPQARAVADRWGLRTFWWHTGLGWNVEHVNGFTKAWPHPAPAAWCALVEATHELEAA